ncbi:MAG: amidohydrolase [Clostridia bacterium]|nr:amidohydrolase [Clostridia bacterium]
MKEFIKVIDENKDLILDAERYIWLNPESGYKEYKTNEYMIANFEKMGYKVNRVENVTGFYADIDTGKPGPTLLFIAELDSLINFKHPDCDKKTGAIHNCGHHAQCATMLGVAAALANKEVLGNLCGKIKLCCVPAEEGIEISYRQELVKKGIIEFTSGKPEFIRRGIFNDVDLAFMVHASPAKDCKFKLTAGHNGVIRKRTVVKGVAAHAGANPHEGVNALNAANLILLAINSLRETFQEKDYVRIHSIITKGGDSVNAVPDEVIIESYVRAANPVMHRKINERVNLTISACAAALGSTVEITDMAGSEALREDKTLSKFAVEVAEKYYGKGSIIVDDEWLASSTDMGDISSLFPSIHAYACGADGKPHGIDYKIVDPINACVDAAKFSVGLIDSLLTNGGEKAKEVINNFTPVFKSVDEYLEHKRSINMSKETVKFNDDGTVSLCYKN